MKTQTRIVLLYSTVLLSGCAAYMHGYTTQEYANRTLSPASKSGAYRLDLESEVDPTIRRYIEDHGDPDYFRVVDINRIYLYYLREDLVAEFVRPALDTSSRMSQHRPIPAGQRSWLPIDAYERIGHTPVTAPTALDECFAKCRELTDRTKEECFDVCRE